MRRNLFLIILLMFVSISAGIAQEERADIRAGNKRYKSGKYSEAEVEYKRALERNINSYPATFNLGGALYKQGRNEDATAAYQKIIDDSTDPQLQARAFYNLGNAFVQQRKLDEAIESYKSSLRINPSDIQAKFNLAYAQKLKEEDKQDDNQDQDQNQDQNQDQDPNQDKDQNQDPKDDKQNPKEQEQNQSRADMERMLKAIQAAEDKTKEKVDKEKEEAQVIEKNRGKQW